MASKKLKLDLEDLDYETKFSKHRFQNDEDEEVAGFGYPELETFFAEGLITEVLYEVKSGKEATVYCCRAGSALGVELAAAKIYRHQQHRNFKNDTIYQEGRVILNQRTLRAVKNKTGFGREAHLGMWIGYEFEHLKQLYAAGAAIPKPYRQADSAILMEYLGDARHAAPILHNVELEPEEARPLFEFVMNNIELWLKHNLIHADLSPFNVLYWEGKLRVIDFPQAVDPRFNPNAYDLLERDISNLCRYWSRYGVQADPERIAKNLWRRFQNSQL